MTNKIKMILLLHSFVHFLQKNEQKKIIIFTVHFVSARCPCQILRKKSTNKRKWYKISCDFARVPPFCPKISKRTKEMHTKIRFILFTTQFFFRRKTRSCWNDGRNGFPRAGKFLGRKWPKWRGWALFASILGNPNGSARTKENEKMRVWSENWRMPIVKCQMFCRFGADCGGYLLWSVICSIDFWGGMWRVLIVKCHMFCQFGRIVAESYCQVSYVLSVLGRVVADTY